MAWAISQPSVIGIETIEAGGGDDIADLTSETFRIDEVLGMEARAVMAMTLSGPL